MEPQFQTSFIPKKPILSGTSSYTSSVTPQPISVISVFGTVVFILTLLVCGGLFGYKQLLNSQIAKDKQDIAAAKEAFQPDTIKELLDVSSRINFTQNLLNSHIAVSQVFKTLQILTVKKIRFDNFIYQNKNGELSLTMEAEAQSYNALAQQQVSFLKEAFIKNPQFSDFNITDNGFITAKFSTQIDSELVSYKKAVESNNTNQ